MEWWIRWGKGLVELAANSAMTTHNTTPRTSGPSSSGTLWEKVCASAIPSMALYNQRTFGRLVW